MSKNPLKRELTAPEAKRILDLVAGIFAREKSLSLVTEADLAYIRLYAMQLDKTLHETKKTK